MTIDEQVEIVEENKNQKEIISLAVDELIAFANHKGGTVYFGVEEVNYGNSNYYRKTFNRKCC
ncbi:Putative DNA-binding domain-containing protein [Lachnospiraceae bacterium RM5]|nr:Putative DNA-binding domain-containing protein [Lachnospiraceae bacterium RM5]